MVSWGIHRVTLHFKHIKSAMHDIMHAYRTISLYLIQIN